MLKTHSTVASFRKQAKRLIVIASEKHFQHGVPQQLLAGDHWLPFTEEFKQLNAGPKGKLLKTFTTVTDIQQVAVVALPNEVSRGNSPTRKAWIYQYTEDLELDPPPAVAIVLDDVEHAAAALGAIARRLRLFNLQNKNAAKREIHVLLSDPSGEIIKPSNYCKSLADQVAWVCRIGDTPPSDMNPKTLAQEIRKLFKDDDQVSFKEIKGEKLLQEKLGGVHAVGRTATAEPRVVILDYQPAKAKKGKHFALIGKGVTYDTGGLSLKVQGSMVGMKMDLGGAAAVIGAFKALVDAKCHHRVTACVGLVENAIGPEAYKPDDILIMHSGKSVEINNTDAEGRLVLADCASYIGRNYKPQVIIDAATLTGAQLVATGLQHAAVVSNDDELEQRALQAGKRSGDLVSPLPFAPEFFEEEFKSFIADMKNSVKNRMNAQSSCAAQFIYSHIADLPVKWLHIDLAGPSSTLNGLATGFGVGLMSQLLVDWQE
ncbi:MAG: M17 family metallopeptidase [Oligoflexus sp.]